MQPTQIPEHHKDTRMPQFPGTAEKSHRFGIPLVGHGHTRLRLAAAVLAVGASASITHASAIFGTLSNFDIYNTTPFPCEGAEIELEGVDPSSIGGDFPAHFANKSIVAYNENGVTGTRIIYTGYNFAGAPTPGSILPNLNPASTNGHQLTNSAGGEHFGFWLNGAQAAATRFYWLNDNNGTYERATTLPEIVPVPTWNYVPGNNGAGPLVQAVVKVPEPVEVVVQKPDSVWMKVFKVKLDNAPQDPAAMQDLLMQLISDADPGNEQADIPIDGIVPFGENAAEIETEWELLEGGAAPKEKMNEDEIDEQNDKTIIRRYEFYEYTGTYDAEHEPITLFLDPGDLLAPPAGELGDFISANMVAAVLQDFAAGLEGDLDGDGFVGISDLNIVLGNWNQDVNANDPLQGDPSGDGFVGIEDLNTVLGNWNAGTPPLGDANIPEPATCLMLFTSFILTTSARDKRDR
jgi:hypothetical protein